MSIKAEIIADSVNPKGKRLTSFVVKFPRIVLAELNTHRAFSRNSASSRAIPFAKMLEMVQNDPFIPLRFQKDHKGMQGVEYFEGEEHEQCVRDWLAARDAAVKAATNFKLPVTKQLRNRLLEPFMWHIVILTATDFENFFALRAHKDAEIHIEALAYKMLEAYNASTPKQLKAGEWHIPFGDKMDEGRLWELVNRGEDARGLDPAECYYGTDEKGFEEAKIKIAIARCARVSYWNFEGKDDYAKDIETCDKLFGSVPRHLSPAEHVAQALDSEEYIGNFCGFKQYRKLYIDENLKDSRVIKNEKDKKYLYVKEGDELTFKILTWDEQYEFGRPCLILSPVIREDSDSDPEAMVESVCIDASIEGKLLLNNEQKQIEWRRWNLKTLNRRWREAMNGKDFPLKNYQAEEIKVRFVKNKRGELEFEYI